MGLRSFYLFAPGSLGGCLGIPGSASVHPHARPAPLQRASWHSGATRRVSGYPGFGFCPSAISGFVLCPSRAVFRASMDRGRTRVAPTAKIRTRVAPTAGILTRNAPWTGTEPASRPPWAAVVSRRPESAPDLPG